MSEQVKHVKFPSIESFAHVLRDIRSYAATIDYAGSWVTTYRGKVKLHGTNAGIHVRDGKIVAAQKRNSILNFPHEDNAGFASWVHMHVKPAFDSAPCTSFPHKNFLVHGEWCGPGVQKGVACSQTSKKFFAIFAVDVDHGDDRWSRVVHPGVISQIIGPMEVIEGVVVLPWQTQRFAVALGGHEPTCMTPAEFAEETSKLVEDVEKRDPFMSAYAGIDGVGEGLVFYALSTEIDFVRPITRLWFKAKGEAHQNVKATKPVTVDIVKMTSLQALADTIVAPGRLEQILTETFGNDLPDMRRTGEFLKALAADVIKECQPEIAESGFEWKEVAPHVSRIGSSFLKSRINSIVTEAA